MKFIAIFCLALSHLYGDMQQDFFNSRSARQSKLMEKITTLKVEAGELREKNVTPFSGSNLQINKDGVIGSAAISYIGYDFAWLVFSGGWYWNSTDEYTTFYSFGQDFADFTIFLASLTVDIARAGQSALDMADTDEAWGVLNNATFYATNAVTTFAGVPAVTNSYAYASDALTFSVDSWSFSDGTDTYQYQIFTTVDDWNLNKDYYLLIIAGFFLDATVNTAEKGTPAPFINYVENYSDGSIDFKTAAKADDIFIYNLRGKLIRHLNGTNKWDGNDRNGTKVETGYYVSNINTQGKEFNLKVLKTR